MSVRQRTYKSTSWPRCDDSLHEKAHWAKASKNSPKEFRYGAWTRFLGRRNRRQRMRQPLTDVQPKASRLHAMLARAYVLGRTVLKAEGNSYAKMIQKSRISQQRFRETVQLPSQFP